MLVEFSSSSLLPALSTAPLFNARILASGWDSKGDKAVMAAAQAGSQQLRQVIGKVNGPGGDTRPLDPRRELPISPYSSLRAGPGRGCGIVEREGGAGICTGRYGSWAFFFCFFFQPNAASWSGLQAGN